ncbi:hypothetical protein [Azospirillum argentinense]|uniref:glycosyltransferase n=1 Tax=Azospirillum argentinense TaxID=2970906 RepID=UPI0032E00860
MSGAKNPGGASSDYSLNSVKKCCDLLNSDFSYLDTLLDLEIPPNPIIKGFLENAKWGSLRDVADRISAYRDAAKERMDGKPKPKLSRVPKISHRIWLTNPHSPQEPPRNYVARLLHDWRHSYGQDWQHWFWVDDEDKIPETVEFIHSVLPTVQFKRYRQELGGGRWLSLINALMSDNKYVFASDILRLKIMQEVGGLYCDLGVAFNAEIDVICDNFEYALIFWKGFHFQNSVLMMPPGNPVADRMMQLAENPYRIPRRIVFPLSGASEGVLFASPIITTIILSMLSSDDLLCPLVGNNRLIGWMAQKSWSTDSGDGKGLLGNAYIPSTKPSYLQDDGWDSIYAPKR